MHFTDIILRVDTGYTAAHLYSKLKQNYDRKHYGLRRISVKLCARYENKDNIHFNHALPLNLNTIITVSDPIIFSIWDVSGATITETKTFEYKDSDECSWELIPYDKDHVLCLLSSEIILVNWRNGECSTFVGGENLATRYSHRSCTRTDKLFFYCREDGIRICSITDGSYTSALLIGDYMDATSVEHIGDDIVAIGTREGIVFFNYVTETILWRHTDTVEENLSLVYFPELKLLACGSGKGIITVLDVRARSIKYVLGDEAKIWFYMLERVGTTWLASCTDQGVLQIWDVVQGTEMTRIQDGAMYSVNLWENKLITTFENQLLVWM